MYRHCSAQIPSIHKVLDHLRESHSEKVKTCHLCGAQYDGDGSLNSHMQSQHGEEMLANEDERVMCEICSKSFPNMTKLKSHLKSAHK